MRTFMAAVWWFAPATILLLQFSPAGLAAGLALMVSAARLLCAPSATPDSEAFEPAPRVTRMLSEAEAPVDLLSRHWFPALMASAGFQVASISLLMGHPVPAAALLAMSAGLLTSVAIGIGAWVEDRPPNLPRSVLGLGLTFLLALMVGVGGGGAGWGFGLGFATGAGEIAGQGDRPERRTVPETNLPGNYSGVIIWPEVKPVTVLVDPMPVGKGGFGRQSRPLTIPFGGEYWMFRWPFRRPPPNSYFRRGTPSALSFSTPDHFPMQMEARQKLALLQPAADGDSQRGSVAANHFTGADSDRSESAEYRSAESWESCANFGPATEGSGFGDPRFPVPAGAASRTIRRNQGNLQSGGWLHGQERQGVD
jgi:hypothetical protein